MGDGGKICYSKASATAGRVAYKTSNGRVIYKRATPTQAGVLNIRLEYLTAGVRHNSRLQFIPGEEEPLGVGPVGFWQSNQSTASMWLGGSMASASYIGDENADTFAFSCVTDAGVYVGECYISVNPVTLAADVLVTATYGEFSASATWHVLPPALDQPIFYGSISYDDSGIYISS